MLFYKRVMLMHNSSLFSHLCNILQKKTQNANSASLLETYMITKHSKKMVRLAKRKGDSTVLYSYLQKDVLTHWRKIFPQRVFKYFPLDISEAIDKRNIETVMNNQIWSSTCKGFNDPFEGHFMFLSPADYVDMGLPENAAKAWKDIIDEVIKHITIVCFTQNPNNMPMWAHYANNHHGFCIEYEILEAEHFYPVIYIDKRLRSKNLFLDLFYYLLRENSTPEEKVTVLEHTMLLSAFKHRDWKYEREVRAIFMNSINEISNNGKLFKCDEVGLKPVKIYAGVNCSQKNQAALQEAVKQLNICYQKCDIINDEGFSVVKEVPHA